MSTIKELATQMSEAFEVRKRNDDEEFYVLKDGSPEWMKTVCQTAHGDMFPDDWRYLFISQVVDIMAESDNEEVEETKYNMEASIYTHELTGWLHSRVDRISWMDEAYNEVGPFDSISDHLMNAQWMEMSEVFGLVLSALQDIANNADEGGDDE